MKIWCRFDENMMHFWCTFDALLKSASNVHHHDALLMHFWCTFQKCIKSASKVHQICIIFSSNFHQSLSIFISKMLRNLKYMMNPWIMYARVQAPHVQVLAKSKTMNSRSTIFKCTCAYNKLWGTSLKYKSRKDIEWQGLWLHKYTQEINHASNQKI